MKGIRIRLQALTAQNLPAAYTLEPLASPGPGAAWRRIILVALTIVAMCMLVGRAAELGKQLRRIEQRQHSLGAPLRWM